MLKETDKIQHYFMAMEALSINLKRKFFLFFNIILQYSSLAKLFFSQKYFC